VRTQRQGRRGEREALSFLQARGLRLVETNYRCRAGEIDLVMTQGETLVFVEVRVRASRRFGGAAASVTPTKQRRLYAAARHYLLSRRGHTGPARFDVVALEGGAAPHWIPNAFDAPLD
jgi:putative endonuclease